MISTDTLYPADVKATSYAVFIGNWVCCIVMWWQPWGGLENRTEFNALWLCTCE